MSNLLINESPLQVLPTLATWVGLNEAIFLQQLHYWLNNDKMGKFVDGAKWIRNTVDEWQETNFPFWDIGVIKRLIKNLENDGLLLSSSQYNKLNIDRTKWYTINYELLQSLSGPVDRIAQKVAKRKEAAGQRSAMTTRKEQNVPIGKEQNVPMEKNILYQSNGTKCTDESEQSVPSNTIDYTETTSEININTRTCASAQGPNLDPLSHAFDLQATHNPQASEPSDFEMYFGSRDEFINIYYRQVGSYPNQAVKDEIIRIAQLPDASPAAWERAIRETFLNYTGQSPPPIRFIEVYEHGGGDYKKFTEWKIKHGDWQNTSGNGGKTNGQATVRNGQPKTYGKAQKTSRGNGRNRGQPLWDIPPTPIPDV